MDSKEMIHVRILISILLLLITGGCVDDVPGMHSQEAEEYLRIRLRIPVLNKVHPRTRAEFDSQLNTLHVIAISGAGEEGVVSMGPIEITEWTEEESGIITFPFELDKSLTSFRDLQLIFLANAEDGDLNEIEKGATSLSDIRKIGKSIVTACAEGLPMAGRCAHADLFSSANDAYTVELIRSVAGVTVAMDSDGSAPDFTVHGVPEELSLTAGINPLQPEGVYSVNPSTCVKKESVTYVAPARNNSTEAPFSTEGSPFIIVKAKYQNKEYYYRLSLTKVDSEGKPEALNMTPNHIYEYKIKGILAPGYDTAEAAAAAGPSTDVDYVIYDSRPEIFNMASDGTRELGCPKEVEDPIGEDCYLEFPIKCFPASADMPLPEFFPAEDWITVDSEPTASNTVTEGKESATMYTFRLHLERNPYQLRREAKVKITWAGLSVEMNVAQDLSFIADRHTAISLDILEEDGMLYRRIEDYWKFVKGAGTDTDPGAAGGVLNAPILYGITEEMNGGLIRNHGVHIPVMNGGRRYRYTITPDFTAAGEMAYYKVRLRRGISPGGDIIFDDTAISPDSPVTITCGGGAYENTVSESMLVLTAYSSDDVALENISMDIYHTGFFDWSDYPAYRADRTHQKTIEEAWYYYEVIPFGMGEEAVYWLDRNIGARSAGYDILDTSGTTIFGNEPSFPFLNGNAGACGGLYQKIASEGTDYEDPVLDSNFGPPGYTIPSEMAFNELRHYMDFITDRAYTENLLSYYQAYLAVDDEKAAYFPKGGQRQNNVISSDNRTGHYWTSTAASGFEKGELGKWLTTFVLSGSSTAFGRARINNPTTAMSARLRNVSDQEDKFYQTHLKVKGATHVFLYSENPFGREWPDPWPGKAVANPDIAFDRFVNFVYESSRNVRYKVIFNYVNESGAVYTMAESEVEKGFEAIGWDAEGSFEFDEDHRLINR